jgi:signal transduction histidine kinase/ligand-binding sensor domain-containing protein
MRIRSSNSASLAWRALIALHLASPLAFALDPSRAISQYGHAAWTMQDGVLPGAPTVMTQSPDGYLWLGTRNGLLRFDGVRFVPFDPPEGEKLSSSRILSLESGSDGALWIGTRSGLHRWRDGHLTAISQTPAQIASIRRDGAGTIWFTRMSVRDKEGPLCRIAGDDAICRPLIPNANSDIARDLKIDSHGNFWTVSDHRLIRIRDGNVRTWVPEGLSDSVEEELRDVVHVVLPARDGTIWVGAMQPSRGLGLLHLDGDRLRAFVGPELDGRKLSVSPMLEDRTGSLWIGTQDEGIYRMHEGKVSRFRRSDGLSSDTIQNLYEDREGTVWVLTTQGVHAFRDLKVGTVSSRQGLRADLANGVLAAHDGTVWVDNWHTLDAWREGKVTTLSSRNGLPGEEVMGLFEDSAGTLWVGIDNEVTVFENGKFTPVRQRDGEAMGHFSSAAQDSAGDIWIMTVDPDLLHRVRGRQVVEQFPRSRLSYSYRAMTADPVDGIWLALNNGDLGRLRAGALEIVPFEREPNTGTVISLATWRDGSVAGASALGISAVRDGKPLTMSVKNGLPCVDVHAVLVDRDGAMWLYATCGVIHVAADQVRAWWNSPGATLKFRVLDAFDGAQAARANFFPKASLAPDGKLWFANASVVQVIDPARLEINPVPPSVTIERLLADRTEHPLAQHLRLPPNPTDVQIDYTGLSFVVPKKMQFRYRLVGHDQHWQQAGARRQAFYNDLPPRDYRFEVTASNSDGVWNSAGASLAFTIAPTFWQTRTFVALCVLSAIGVVWLAFVLRLRQVAGRIRARAEERVAERERIARDLHDTLLQGLLSASLQLSVANGQIVKDAPAKPLVERILQLLRLAIDEGRDAVRDLRSRLPPTDALEQAFAQVPKDLGADESMQFRLLVDGTPRPLHPAVRDEVYRIGREALANAFRHSKATHTEAVLEYCAERFRLCVRDNGCGMEPDILRRGRDGHWGLSGLRERSEKIGATLRVMSAPGAGTEIELLVPAAAAYQNLTTHRVGWRRWLDLRGTRA